MKDSRIELVRYIEALAANAWRPAIEQHVDGWRLRVTGGSSSRVNSVWPNMMFGTLSLEERVEIVEDFYRRHGMPACFQICPAALPEDLYSVLKERGYRDEKATSVRTASIDRVIERVDASMTAEVVHTQTLTDEWFQAYTGASGYAADSLPIREGILSRIGPESGYFVLNVDGNAAATGLGVVERGWLGVFCVVTLEDFRRQGLATQVMRELAVWGKNAGAAHAYLQVMDNNPPALEMYAKLGFEKLYEYWYTFKPLG